MGRDLANGVPLGTQGAEWGRDAAPAWHPEECLREAEAAKEAGNALLRRGEAGEACARYKEGLELVRLYRARASGKARGREQQQRAEAIYVALHLNLAQACLKQRDWAGTAEHADKVLQVDQQNLKALYRRAVARSHVDSALEQACEDFRRVLELDPGSAEAREQLERTQELLRSFYDHLGVHPGATAGQVRQAYLREAKRWHPDKADPADRELAERRFKAIAEAHDVLRDARRRQHYDLYLQCRAQGYVEFEDPEDPSGGCVQVRFRDWGEFRRILEQGVSSAEAREAGADGPGRSGGGAAAPPADDPDDAPLSAFEWLLGGGVLLAVWCVSVWRHNRRQWLRALPLEILEVHEEYSIPVGLLMSPLFFGNVPFRDAVRWMRAMVGDAVPHYGSAP